MRYAWLSVWVVIAECTVGSATFGQDATVEKVFGDWATHRDRLKVLHYVVEGELRYVKGGTFDFQAVRKEDRELPHEDVKLKLHRSLLLDYVKQRHRVDVRDEDYVFPHGIRGKEEYQSTFNGTEYQYRNHLASQQARVAGEPPTQDLAVTKGNLKYGLIDSLTGPIHIAHGNLYTATDRIHPGKLKTSPRVDKYKLTGETFFESRRCLILRESPSDGERPRELWVDVERNHLPVRIMELSGQQPLIDQIIQYQKSDSGWLPGGWSETLYGDVQGKWRVQHVINMKVVSLTISDVAADIDFDLVAKPGELVSTRTNDGTVGDTRKKKPPPDYYRVDEQGRFQPVEFVNGVEKRKWNWLWWSIAVALLFGTAVSGWWSYRRWVRRKAILSDLPSST